MSKLFLVTGANGHLGNTVVEQLIEKGEKVRCLILNNTDRRPLSRFDVEILEGDVCNKESLEPFFENSNGDDLYVIHTAGIVSIASKKDDRVYQVNVNGTKNIVDMCIEKGVKKLVHVSSVHAIIEGKKGDIIREQDSFDPNKVEGLYAKTKAEATQYVLDSVKRGLNVSVVHPSGITGPNDFGRGHLTQLVTDYLNGALTIGVKGAYDFVDVRDVANGTINAVELGKNGACYILANKRFEIKEIFDLIHIATGKKRVKSFLPIWFAKIFAPICEWIYKLKKKPPLYTSYSLYTLQTNCNFDSAKAKNELGYKNRSMLQTIRDTADFLIGHDRIKRKQVETLKRAKNTV